MNISQQFRLSTVTACDSNFFIFAAQTVYICSTFKAIVASIFIIIIIIIIVLM